MRRRFPLLLAPVLVAGCAHGVRGYPSLAPRAVEKQSFDEPARPLAVATTDPALDAGLAKQGADLDRIVAGFDGAAATARREVERSAGKPVGGEAWLDAQAALARLDDWRGQAGALTSELNDLAAARAAKLQPPYPALDALAARAAAENVRETETVQELQRRVANA